uniref:Immunoglobulin domain-containing protein n=1 Tax=Strix occidentalis caurina TaxID=311401 RepID=A0A8D0F6N6_STROC
MKLIEEETIHTEATHVVHALPGADVTLVCSFPKAHTTYIIQTQWSKNDDNHLTRIAVHHPNYGTHYFAFPEASYNFSWALHLKNVTVSLSGWYECSFTTYPYGTKAAEIQLIVKAEVQLNQTLEIPCLEDTTSENLSNYPLKWLVVSIFHLRYKFQKELQIYRNSSVLYGQRVRLGLNNTLKIFPTKITDDGRVFSCHVVYHPERVQKSSTTVRVFGKGLMPTASLLALGKVILYFSFFFFPQEISIEQEDLQDSEGFYQLRSTLVLQGTHQTHKTFSCACLFSFLKNETWNISSEEIFVSFGRFFIDKTHLKCKMLRTPNTCILCYLKSLYRVSFPGGVRNTKASRFPWPTVVAVLLLFCSLLIALGIRKWCQYQKEIQFFSPEPPTSISLPDSCFCSLILHGYLRTCFNEIVLLGQLYLSCE